MKEVETIDRASRFAGERIYKLKIDSLTKMARHNKIHLVMLFRSQKM